jgi:tetratricopeptide (TPR) repeat protein
MGEVYRHVGNYERALACHTKQLQIALEIGNPSVILTAVGYIGSIYNAQKQFAEAERFCQRATVLGRVLKVRYYLGEFLFVNAIICVRQQRYEEAQSYNEEALAIVRQVGHQEIEFKAEVLTIQMQLILGQISMSQAVAHFEKLLAAWPGDKEQAALRYELWSLDKTQEQHRQIAARLYSTLYDNIPDMEYGQRYQKLTGKDLPESLPFPEMPEILTRNLPLLNELIEQVDYMIAQ